VATLAFNPAKPVSVSNIPVVLFGDRTLTVRLLRPFDDIVRGERKLFNAIFSGDIDSLKSQLNNGANPNATLKCRAGAYLSESLRGGTPLHATVVSYILAYDAIRGDIGNALHLKGGDRIPEPYYSTYDKAVEPVKAAQLKMVKLLLSKGADLNGRNAYGFTPLMAAAFWGETELAKHFIENGADLNTQVKLHPRGHVFENFVGFTALMFAIKQNRFDIARLLIENGADTKITSTSGETAVSLAKHWASTVKGSEAHNYTNWQEAERLIVMMA
jgi:ankyrin repeat protein